MSDDNYVFVSDCVGLGVYYKDDVVWLKVLGFDLFFIL